MHHLMHHGDALLIQRVGRLIQKQKIRLLHNCLSQQKPLLHAQGVFAVRPLISRVQADSLYGCLYLITPNLTSNLGQKL